MARIRLNGPSRCPDDRSQGGIFDFAEADSPFTGHSYMFVSSCTGEAHLGDVSQEYSPALTVQHRGLVNGTAAVDHLAAHYPGATEVVVVGKTAGSVAAPVYGGLVSDRLPDARVTVFGGQSGAWPGGPDFNTTVLNTRWGAYDAVPEWAVDGLTPGEWGPPSLWSQAGRHDPGLVLSRFDFAHDPNAAVEVTGWMNGSPPDLLAGIDANEAAIEAAGVPLHSYTAPGEDHGIFEFDKFYEIEVEGARLSDRVAALLTDEPPEDVHCEDCD